MVGGERTSPQWIRLARTGRIPRLVAPPQLPAPLRQSIERCAEALGDMPRLKHEVSALKSTGDGLAHFAAALFELELAREGDPESRAAISHLAEVLLVFWRDGSGDELSRMHPSLQSLWLSVAPMLVQFELRQFDQALVRCWKSRDDLQKLAEAITWLEPSGNKRVEFARCVYHLELARKGVDASRSEFARRAGLLSEAYQDPAIANDLIGHDAGLLHLWGELKPYLDEFFEAMEEQAARAQESTKKVPVPQAPVSRAEVKTDPALQQQPPLGSTREVPSFRTLTQQPKPAAPPPPPANLTPPGSWVPDADVVIEEAAPPPPPPPPLDLTPPGAWKPPKTPTGEIELLEVDVLEVAPPPPPPVTPAHGLAAAVAIAEAEEVEFDFEPSEATLAFWDYTFASLQLAPADGLRARMLATESRADRKRLTTWLEGLGAHLAVPEARAFASLVRLVLASETKEKSLFGQSNPRRKEALTAAFALLSPHPEAAGHAAVWFEMDGWETQQALQRGLELLTPFLAFCARQSLDPLRPETVEKYLET
jgi:hypothetical protein